MLDGCSPVIEYPLIKNKLFEHQTWIEMSRSRVHNASDSYCVPILCLTHDNDKQTKHLVPVST